MTDINCTNAILRQTDNVRPMESLSNCARWHTVPEHVRHGLGQMLAIAVSTLSHHIPEQDGPLRKIDYVIQRGSNRSEGSTRIASSKRLESLR